MANSFVSLVCLAVVSQALGAPTPAGVNSYYGTYVSVPALDQNFREFLSVFNLPADIDLSRPTFAFFYKDGEYYVDRLVFAPHLPPVELRYKIGETETTTFNGRTVEYTMTVETGAAGETVYKTKFRCTETDLKFTIEFTLTPDGGFQGTYTREGVVARRTYKRTVNPNIAGFYVNLPEKQSANFLELANRLFPAPQGLSWDSKTGLWLGRLGNDYVIKVFITPSVYVTFPFQFGEKRTIELNGKTFTYKFTLVEENFLAKTVTIRGEVTNGDTTVTETVVITPEGATATYKVGEETASRYYKRVLSPLAFGTFKNVPEYSENWAAFATALGKEDDSAQKTKLNIYREGDSNYFKVTYESGKEHTHPFLLNKPYEETSPNGVPIKYTFTQRPSYSNDAYVRAEFKYGDKSFYVDMFFNATGVTSTYHYGTVVARRFYRRVIPTTYLGQYQATPATPEFAQFATTIGKPQLTGPVKSELRYSPEEKKYYDTLTIEGKPEPIVLSFELGKIYDTTFMGKPVKYTYYYFSYPAPVLHAYFFEPNTPNRLAVTLAFGPTGYTATYLKEGRFGTRTYTKV